MGRPHRGGDAVKLKLTEYGKSLGVKALDVPVKDALLDGAITHTDWKAHRASEQHQRAAESVAYANGPTYQGEGADGSQDEGEA